VQEPGGLTDEEVVAQFRIILFGAVDEAIRLIPPVALIERWAGESLEVEGVRIPAVEFVGIPVLAANKDPETFPDPLTFDIRRPNAARALSFSFGIHACLGVHLSQVDTVLTLEKLLERLPEMTLVDHEPPAGFTFRRSSQLIVGWQS
jgi:cytochrome P450